MVGQRLISRDLRTSRFCGRRPPRVHAIHIKHGVRWVAESTGVCLTKSTPVRVTSRRAGRLHGAAPIPKSSGHGEVHESLCGAARVGR